MKPPGKGRGSGQVSPPTEPVTSGSKPYEVGYGRPPLASRFAKGQSGNPAGRRRGAKNRPPKADSLKAIILAEAWRGIATRDGNREVTMPMVQAVLRSMALNAVKGNPRAQGLFVNLLAVVEDDRTAAQARRTTNLLNYKITWERELERRRHFKLDLPPPFPHPDVIQYHPVTGVLTLFGPATRDAIPEAITRTSSLYAELMAANDVMLKFTPDEIPPEDRDWFYGEIAETEKVLRIGRAILGYGEGAT